MRYLILILFSISILGCKSEYEKKLFSELDSGITHDSLLFNLRVGQSQKQFYDSCWALNKRQLVKEGTGANMRLLIPIDDADSTKAKDILFFGIFDEKKTLQGIWMEFTYSAWSPWNKELQSDKLLADVIMWAENTYPGNKFEPLDLDKKIEYKAYLKIDGDRHITAYQTSAKDVKIKIENSNYLINRSDKKK